MRAPRRRAPIPLRRRTGRQRMTCQPRAPAAVAAAPAVELAPATLETQPSAVVERQPSVVVLGERSGSMAFTTSVGDGIDQEVMRRARSSHTLRSAGVCM